MKISKILFTVVILALLIMDGGIWISVLIAWGNSIKWFLEDGFQLLYIGWFLDSSAVLALTTVCFIPLFQTFDDCVDVLFF